MSNFLDKIKYFIGIQDLEDEDNYDEYGYEDYDADLDYESEVPAKVKKFNNKVLNIHTNSNMKIMVHEPQNYEDAPKIVDDLKARKAVVVNLEKLELNVKKNIFDFISGGIYAIEGNMLKVTKDIFIFAPNNIEIDGIKEEIVNKGLFSWQ